MTSTTDVAISNYNFPIAVIEEYINATDHQTVFVDCYGNALKRANIGGKKTITFENHFYRNDVDYLFISLLSSDNPINYNFYFKYTGTSDGYSVSAIEEKEYNDAFDIYNGNQDLIPWYDRKGNIIAHIYRSNGIFYIYDKNQNFVNSFNYGSFSSYMSANSLFLEFEKKMYIFSYGEYYANVSEKSSKTSYKCACIEIDIVTGKVSYDDDFKYFIEDTDTIKYDNKYQYTCFTYYELNDKGERGDLLMCSIAKKCLSFENSFVYDGFNGKVYKVNRNSVIAQFSGIPYVCTKNERKVLYSNIAYFVSGNKIIAGKVSASYSGKCFICDRNDFVENNKNPSVLYDYISGYRYFGDYITINSDSKTGEYKCTNNGITLDVDSAYFNFVDKGCIVNRGGIYLPNGEMILSSSRSLVGSVGIVLSINNFSIFEVNLNDSTTIYFSIEKTLV